MKPKGALNSFIWAMDDFTHGRFIDLDRALNEPPPETRRNNDPVSVPAPAGGLDRDCSGSKPFGLLNNHHPRTNETQFTPKPGCHHVRDRSNGNHRCADRIKAYRQLAGRLAASAGHQIHRNSVQTSGERKLGLTPCCSQRRGNSWQSSQLAKFTTWRPSNCPLLFSR